MGEKRRRIEASFGGLSGGVAIVQAFYYFFPFYASMIRSNDKQLP